MIQLLGPDTRLQQSMESLRKERSELLWVVDGLVATLGARMPRKDIQELLRPAEALLRKFATESRVLGQLYDSAHGGGGAVSSLLDSLLTPNRPNAHGGASLRTPATVARFEHSGVAGSSLVSGAVEAAHLFGAMPGSSPPPSSESASAPVHAASSSPAASSPIAAEPSSLSNLLNGRASPALGAAASSSAEEAGPVPASSGDSAASAAASAVSPTTSAASAASSSDSHRSSPMTSTNEALPSMSELRFRRGLFAREDQSTGSASSSNPSASSLPLSAGVRSAPARAVRSEVSDDEDEVAGTGGAATDPENEPSAGEPGGAELRSGKDKSA